MRPWDTHRAANRQTAVARPRRRAPGERRAAWIAAALATACAAGPDGGADAARADAAPADAAPPDAAPPDAGAPDAAAPDAGVGCGDGVIAAPEACDDGGRTDGDGCSAACEVEPYFRCAGEPSQCARVAILYAPTEPDDAAYRAAIAEITGGPVDYLDARAAPPGADALAGYDCIYTWVNEPYGDRAAFGDALADFVDAGGVAVLGVFTTYTFGNSLGGRVMTESYSPVVSPTGMNHFSPAPYAGDGTTALHAGVNAYECEYRDRLALQGDGRRDGSYADGEIAAAYRPDFRVVYINGGGASALGCAGDWPRLIANACSAAFSAAP